MFPKHPGKWHNTKVTCGARVLLCALEQESKRKGVLVASQDEKKKNLTKNADRRNVWLLIVTTLLLIASFVAFKPPSERINQGLDIQGGLSVVLSASNTDGSAVSDEDMEKSRAIIENRAWTAAELQKLGFTMTPSSANFLFARHETLDGGALYRTLKARGILVRHFDDPKICQYNRITIGSRQQMQALIDALRDILEETA